MFKKKPQIKNLAPLRSSDRRKLADQIIAEYHISIPTAPTESNEQTASTQPLTDNSTATPTLSSIRTSLVPEICLSARFTTHAGANATLVSGTVYVGAYAGQEDRILWIQYGKEPKLYPTVYSLWQNPGLVPLLHTQDFVIEKLRTGADLMTPGLVGGPPWPENAIPGRVVAVAGLSKESVPVWVGVCKIDVSSLGRVQGLKGAAVEGVHWDGDELWNWSQTGGGGRVAPDRVEGWEVLTKRLEGSMQDLDIDDDDDEEDGQDDGGVAIQPSSSEIPKRDANGSNGKDDDEEQQEPDYEPTTAEIDHAFFQAFLYSLYNSKKNGSPPNYGIDLPIQPSVLISSMIQPHLRSQNQNYTIKKTSWKNTKKFIKFLDKKTLVKSKDRNGGETVILDIDFNDQELKDFQPYRLPKPKTTTSTTATETETDTNNNNDISLNQKLTLLTLYRASSKLVPDLIPSKTAYYTSSQIAGYLKTYIENNSELTAATTSKRNIKLDPFIANNILGSNTSANDTKILAAGEIGRDVLSRRILEDDHLCNPHWVLLRNNSTYDPSRPQPSDPKPKAGPAPQVTLTMEKRTGTKTVTKISGLESFFINPQVLGPELQKKCAGSASVAQFVGGKLGTMEIVVQGDQRDVVEKELARRGVRREWIGIVDKVKKKK